MSDDDAQVLHGLGYAVTTAAGLAHLSGRQARRLMSGLSSSSQHAYRLTIVGWQVANVARETPDRARDILRHIYDLESAFGYRPSEVPFDFWHPNEAQFDRIRAAISFRDRRLIRAAFSTRVPSTKSAVDAFNRLCDESDVDLVTAERDLRRVLVRAVSVPQSTAAKVALARYRRAVERATTEKFAEAAAEASDPVAGMLLMLGKKVAEDWLEGEDNVVKAEQVINHQCPTLTNQSGEAIADLRQRVELLVKIQRALQQYN
jgi:hypothetical protein